MLRLLSPVLLLLIFGCTNLPEIGKGVCGNGVLDADEDCDGASTIGTCAAADDDANACFFVCDENRQGCPDGWECGDDLRCRERVGRFAEPGPTWDFGVEDFEVGDVDGDGNADLIGNSTTRLIIRFGAGDGTFDSAVEVFTRKPEGPVSFGDLSGDGLVDAVVPIVGGIATFLGTAARSLEPVAYPLFSLPVGGLVIPVATDELFRFPLLTFVGDQVYEIANPEAPLSMPRPVNEVAGEIRRSSLIPKGASLVDSAARYNDRQFLVVGYAGDNTVYLIDTVVTPASAAPVLVDVKPGIAEHQNIRLPDGYVVGSRGATFADVDGLYGPDVVIHVVNGSEDRTAIALNQYDPDLFNDDDVRFELVASLVNMKTTVIDEAGPNLRSIIAAADFNGDDAIDYISTFGAFLCDDPPCVPVNDGAAPARLTLAGVAPSVGQWVQAEVGDFNGDGYRDFVTRIDGVAGVFAYLGSAGTGYFAEYIIPTDAPPSRLRIGNFDGDGVDDVAYVVRDSGDDVDRVMVAFGQTSGFFSEPVEMTRAPRIRAFEPYLFNLTFEYFDVVEDLAVSIGNSATGWFAALQGSSSRRLVAPLFVLKPDEEGQARVRPTVRAMIGEFSVDGTRDVIALQAGEPNTTSGNGIAASEDIDIFFLKGASAGLFSGVQFAESAGDKFVTQCSKWESAQLKADPPTEEILAINGTFECHEKDDPAPEIVVYARGPEGGNIVVADEPVAIPDTTLKGVTGIEAFDADNDGDQDFVIVFGGEYIDMTFTEGSSGLAVYWNGDTIVQSASPVEGLPLNIRDAAHLRIDGDDIPELAILASDIGMAESTTIYQSKLDMSSSPKSFGAPEPIAQVPGARALRAADVNGDGLEDMVLLIGDQVQVILALPRAPLGNLEGDRFEPMPEEEE